MGESIGFDKEKLSQLASDFKSAYDVTDPYLWNIIDRLGIISNPLNWSGPIADSAKNDLNKAITAAENIKKNMKTINSILSEAASNFEGIRY